MRKTNKFPNVCYELLHVHVFYMNISSTCAFCFSGVPQRSQIIELAPKMPTMRTENLVWVCIGDATTQRALFQAICRNNKAVKLADWILCNSANDLEPSAFTLAPGSVPIGPMLASNRLGNSAGNFWAEDAACLKWLDQQPPCSVIYIAFGSFTVFDQTQFHELALGLELSKRPFLWVVREDIGDYGTTHAYPEGFLERIGCRGRIVSWAPQQKVLGHPSVACFLSHCGWNSTIEGVINGLPFLCWPYFADQFLNESYICDVWKVGLGFSKNESGIIERGEIKNKVDQLLGDEMFRERALKLKELARNSVMEGGQSSVVFENFVKWVKS